jgi:hypothetical protein
MFAESSARPLPGTRAIEVAIQARDGYRDTKDATKLAEADAWIATHTRSHSR